MFFKRTPEMRRALYWGLTLIIVGGVFLADRTGHAMMESVWHVGPALIALHGALVVLFATNLAQVIDGVFSIVVGFWVYACIEHLWGWTFIATWPVIVIGAGIVMVLRGVLDRADASTAERTQ